MCMLKDPDIIYRIIKLYNDEVAVAGDEKVYLIDINNYLILNEINSDCWKIVIINYQIINF